MRHTVVLRYIGTVLIYVAALMGVSALISYMDGDSAFSCLTLSAVLTFVLGIFPLLFTEKPEEVSSKDCFLIVTGAWMLCCIVGTFPYLMWGGEFDLANAWFESVSGFTATGASILNDIEALPQGLLFWRTATNWVGGVGVVMLAIIILPSIGMNKSALTSIELSSLSRDNFRYRTQIIVQIMIFMYVGFTLISMFSLKAAGMRWFDALNHAMSATATGGFSTKNLSVGAFDSPLIEGIIMVTIFISSLHYGLLYATVFSRGRNVFRSQVVRTYILIIFFTIAAVTYSLWDGGIYDSFSESLRRASFQVMSLITTAGFATADTNLWTPFAIMMLIFVSIFCACAGSTSGGMKVDRLLIFYKILKNQLRLQRHPNAVLRVKVDGVVQDEKQLRMVMIFVASYISLILLGTLFASMCGVDLMTAVTSSISSIGNVGPGFAAVGSLNNYSSLPDAVKYMDTVLMLMGRLEILGFIQFIFIGTWR